MAKNKKYSFKLEQNDSNWQAQIVRQVTSRKTMVSKSQDGFNSEAQAKEWAEQQLQEFTNAQGKSNQRHGEQRKLNEQQRTERSARRAEKTQLAKEQKLANDLNPQESGD